MTEHRNAGIWGVGAYLPPEVRTNDWWSPEVVAGWRKGTADVEPEQDRAQPQTEGERLVLEAMAEHRRDPFFGSVERRILDDSLDASDMEIEAARLALDDAGVRPEEIDLLLVASLIPDFQMSPNACRVQDSLGLSRSCFVTGVDSACNSFHAQLTLAAAMIRSGSASRALIVQSSLIRRVIPEDSPMAPWFGDGATALVVGPVAEGYGLLAAAHRVDGGDYDALVTSVPGKRWYADGLPIWHARKRGPARNMITHVADQGREVVHAALETAGLQPADVDFYASHQATPWFRRITQMYAGLDRARFADTFGWTGHVSACNVPLSLMAGARDGLLRQGDVVATYSGGTGVTWSGMILRWGGHD